MVPAQVNAGQLFNIDQEEYVAELTQRQLWFDYPKHQNH
jgi:hypothetical protein